MVSCWQSWTWPPVMANTFVAYAMLCMFVYINTDVFSPWHSPKQAWLPPSSVTTRDSSSKLGSPLAALSVGLCSSGLSKTFA